MDNINHSTNICQQKSIFEIPVIFWVIILFFCFYFSISFFKKKAEKNKHECKSTQTDFIVFPSLSFNFDNPQMKINPPKTSCINFTLILVLAAWLTIICCSTTKSTLHPYIVVQKIVNILTFNSLICFLVGGGKK